MLSRAYGVGDCLVGCIYGTGTNAAYVDDIETFTKLPEEVRKRGGKMIANTEWGAFDNEVPPFFPLPLADLQAESKVAASSITIHSV